MYINSVLWWFWCFDIIVVGELLVDLISLDFVDNLYEVKDFK